MSKNTIEPTSPCQLYKRYINVATYFHRQEKSRKDKGKGVLGTILTLSTDHPNYALTSEALLKRPAEDSTTYRL